MMFSANRTHNFIIWCGIAALVLLNIWAFAVNNYGV